MKAHLSIAKLISSIALNVYNFFATFLAFAGEMRKASRKQKLKKYTLPPHLRQTKSGGGEVGSEREKLPNLISLNYFSLTLFLGLSSMTFAQSSQIIECMPKKTAAEIATQSMPDDLPLYPNEIKKIIENGVIRIAMKQSDSDPFFFQEGGEFFGLDFELGCAIAKELDIRAEFIRSTDVFNEVANNVVKEEADIAISKLSKTIQREQKMLFTEPYAKFSHGFLINRERVAALPSQGDKYKNIVRFIKEGQLEIGVIKNSSYEYFANKYLNQDKNNPIKMVTYSEWNDLVSDVAQGKVAIAYRDIMEVKKVLKKNPEMAIKLRPAIIAGTEDNIAIAVNAKYQHLHYWLNQFLQRHLAKDSRVLRQEMKRKNKCIHSIRKNFKEHTAEEAINQFCQSDNSHYYDSNSILNSDFRDKKLFSPYLIANKKVEPDIMLTTENLPEENADN